jgi:outer membrane protein
MIEKHTIRLAAVILAALTTATGSAHAGDNNGNFMVRLLGTEVVTQETANTIKLNPGTGTYTDLKGAGNDATVSDPFIPAATLTYFFNKNIAVELFCCAAYTSVTGKGPTLGPLGKIADTWIFPPVLTAQYHFDPIMGIKPYVGAGVEYIHYFNSRAGKSVGGSVDFSDSWGLALQAGLDYQLGNGWYLNADIKKVWLDTDVTWRNPLAAGYVIKSNVDIDPLIISAGVGYRFNIEDLLGGRSAPAPLK